MTQKRVYELAHEMMLIKWAREKEILDKNPDDELARLRATEYLNDLNWLERKLKREYGVSIEMTR